MTKIKNLPAYPIKENPDLQDFLVGTEKTTGDTRSFTIQGIANSVGGLIEEKNIVPIGKFLIIKASSNSNNNILEINDFVQGIVENSKIEAIYIGEDPTSLSSFNLITEFYLYS